MQDAQREREAERSKLEGEYLHTLRLHTYHMQEHSIPGASVQRARFCCVEKGWCQSGEDMPRAVVADMLCGVLVVFCWQVIRRNTRMTWQS